MPSSRTHFFSKSEQFKFACLELSKRSKRSRFIWEEIQLRTRVTGERDASVVDSIVNPVECHAYGACDLRHGEISVDSEASELLEVTRVTIYAWIEAKRLLAWRATRRGMLIPAEQIVGPGTVVPGMERVLDVISEPAAAWDFLTEESPFMDPNGLQWPIYALKAGELDAVVAAAHSFLEAFT
jgi:excisionase family DNA binding protein